MPFDSLKWSSAARVEFAKLELITTGGDHFRFGFMLHRRGIEPLIYTYDATFMTPEC